MNIYWYRLYTKINAAYRLSKMNHKNTLWGGGGGKIPESLNFKLNKGVQKFSKKKKKTESRFKILGTRSVTSS